MVARLVIAAPASGHGKTTVATGLLAAFAARGLRVAPFKVGPDYIDPGYHALAAGRPGRNLDPVLVGEERIGPLFAHGSAGADIAVVEGVMGLFDGRTGAGEFGSTAHVAKLLDAPVVLVVDAAAQARSIAAVVHGFRSFGSGVRIAGVVLNRVGSDRHELILRDACAEVGTPVLGVLRRHDAVAAPSRHLGLVPVVERHSAAMESVRALAGLVAASVDLDAVAAVARSAPPLHAVPWSPSFATPAAGPGALPSTGRAVLRSAGPAAAGPGAGPGASSAALGARASAVAGAASAAGSSAGFGAGPFAAGGGGVSAGGLGAGELVVAVAGGPAFSFGYAETVELLEAAGATVSIVDPLRDEALPPGTRGLVVGGGFPEVYAEQLAANAPLRAAVAALAAAGGPIAAECAGLLWLARSLDGKPMCGVLDVDAAMTPKLTLGYRDAVAVTGSVLAVAGTRVSGHEFHRTAVGPPSGATAAWAWSGDAGTVREGFAVGSVHASYLHLHWAGAPDLAHRFVSACR